MDAIEDVQISPCNSSKYIQPYRVKFKQNGIARVWDCTRQHDSVAVLMYNSTKESFVLVKQFRPAVYMKLNEHMLEDHFKEKLSHKDEAKSEEPTDNPPKQKSIKQYGPGSEGVTYELCAGIVDKSISLEEIVQEEILEETGFKVPLAKIEYVTTYHSSVGISGTKQHFYYTEVTEDMKVTLGGGVVQDGEMIDVVYLPLKESVQFIFDTSRPKSTGLCFAFMWFQQFKKPSLK